MTDTPPKRGASSMPWQPRRPITGRPGRPCGQRVARPSPAPARRAAGAGRAGAPERRRAHLTASPPRRLSPSPTRAVPPRLSSRTNATRSRCHIRRRSIGSAMCRQGSWRRSRAAVWRTGPASRALRRGYLLQTIQSNVPLVGCSTHRPPTSPACMSYSVMKCIAVPAAARQCEPT